VMVNPPVFLSEEEALQVITEELAQTGLTFPERKVPMRGSPYQQGNSAPARLGRWEARVEACVIREGQPA